jgi:hypothetical protein
MDSTISPYLKPSSIRRQVHVQALSIYLILIAICDLAKKGYMDCPRDQQKIRHHYRHS